MQTNIPINRPGDIHEREAEHVSEQVMSTSTSHLRRSHAGGGEWLKGQTEPPGRAPDRWQPKHIGSSDLGQGAAPPVVHEVLRSPGGSLDEATRLFMEPRFGHDFSKLRVHTDSKAAESAHAVGAAAYTVGNDVVFGAGEFNPQSNDGRRLIAHELTHVVQQSGGNVQHLNRQPKKEGRVVRVEHPRKFRRKPPGPGAYTQAELNDWYQRHPKAKSAGGANLVDGERTKAKEYTPEELWWRGYYYAKTTVDDDMQQGWETWLNDEGDGTVITVYVRYKK